MTDIDNSQYLNSIAYRYHAFTKHSLESLYSKSGSLDWDTQPDPFRSYAGCGKQPLPCDFLACELDIFQLIKVMLAAHKANGTETALPPPAVPGDLKFISSLLFNSMAISAWKQIRGTDHKWALRVNPSSGNLHPTETHFLVRGIDGIENGAYHYSVNDHSYEKRSDDNVLSNVWSLLSRPEEEAPPMMLVLNSIFWREAWKYRDRAYRYCQLDLGHAAAAICLAASAYGWESKVIAEFPDMELAKHIGQSSSDEKPMLLIPLWPGGNTHQLCNFDLNARAKDYAAFRGVANRLSSSTIEYPSIEEVYLGGCISPNNYLQRLNTRKEMQARGAVIAEGREKIDLTQINFQAKNQKPALEIIRKRRSAVDMDGNMRISLARMSRILIDSTRGFSSSYLAPLSVVADEEWRPYFIHIILYVHKVDGIAPGVYLFDRNSFELTQLSESNVRNQAKFVSCLQDIASDGVFAVSLVADFREAFRMYSERAYRYVHQEAGFIGQLFYLTALALEIDATGIGCFLDDEINQSLPEGMQVVYNFTFGRAVLDSRLTDLPAYDFA